MFWPHFGILNNFPHFLWTNNSIEYSVLYGMNIFWMNILDFVLNWILNWIIFRPDSMKKWIFKTYRLGLGSGGGGGGGGGGSGEGKGEVGENVSRYLWSISLFVHATCRQGLLDNQLQRRVEYLEEQGSTVVLVPALLTCWHRPYTVPPPHHDQNRGQTWQTLCTVWELVSSSCLCRPCCLALAVGLIWSVSLFWLYWAWWGF